MCVISRRSPSMIVILGDCGYDWCVTRKISITLPDDVAQLLDREENASAYIAEAIRLLLRTTHNLAEGAGAAGLAGLLRLRETLSGKKVAVIVSGGNIDAATLRRVLQNEI